MGRAVLVVLVLGTLLVLQAGCGGGPVCGDGMAEGDEVCDDGNVNEYDSCTATCAAREPTVVRVEWSLAAREFAGFSETCGGVGADTIRLRFAGTEERAIDADCAYMSTLVRGLAPGQYQLNAQLFDVDAATGAELPLTNVATAAAVTVSEGTQADAVLDFPAKEFSDGLSGSYYFRTKWGGADTCKDAKPPVDVFSIRLERGDRILAGQWRNLKGEDEPNKFDGKTRWNCRDFAGEFPILLRAMPWGPAKITLVGLGQGGDTRYQQTFDTFIGAGTSNPEFAFDVGRKTPDPR